MSGLGGLAAAIAIREGGHEVTVIESAPQLAEVGTKPGLSVTEADKPGVVDWSRSTDYATDGERLQKVGFGRKFGRDGR